MTLVNMAMLLLKASHEEQHSFSVDKMTCTNAIHSWDSSSMWWPKTSNTCSGVRSLLVDEKVLAGGEQMGNILHW